MTSTTPYLLIACALLTGCGPSAEELSFATDKQNLQPYANLPSGTLVKVTTRGTNFDYTKSVEPIVSPSLVSGLYLFHRVSFGNLELRSTNDPDGRVIRFAGRMIDSIVPVTNATIR